MLCLVTVPFGELNDMKNFPGILAIMCLHIGQQKDIGFLLGLTWSSFSRDKCRLFHFCTSPVMFSTMDDGKIVRGLGGVPNEGPVLLVGYHMLFGTELPSLFQEFLREKKVIVRGMAHLEMFTSSFGEPSKEFSAFDYLNVFGALPATGTNLFKALSAKSFVVLYPGGVREALHRKVCSIYTLHICISL